MLEERDSATNALRVVLVHWNQAESCVETIERFLASSVPVEVTVVDNGSSGDQITVLRYWVHLAAGLGKPVRLIETGRNLGFGPGANVGLADCLADPDSGDWFVLAPHDVDPAPLCLQLMLGAASEHPMAGLMCADVGDGMTPVIDPYFGGMTVPATNLDTARPRWESVDYPHGTLMMLKRSCLDEIGLFDERYFSYCEEADLALRAMDAGFEIGLIRGARVTNTHIGSGIVTVDYLQTRNTLLLVEEHSGRYHAFIRLCIAMLQILRGLKRPEHQPLIFDARARAAGIRDYLLRRFGAPPSTLTKNRRRR